MDADLLEKYYIALSDMQRVRMALHILQQCLDNDIRDSLVPLHIAADKCYERFRQLHEQMHNW